MQDMARHLRQHGFSLTETLFAVGTLAVGMMFIAGTFLTGVYFATVSTERTIGTVVAEEAFAKMRLYGLDPNHPGLTASGFTPYEQLVPIPAPEFLYPSTPETGRQYSWAALCRRISANSPLVQCTVFVSRMTGMNSKYWVRQTGGAWPPLAPSDLPRPVRIMVLPDAASLTMPEVSIKDAVSAPTDMVDELTFVNDGSVLVDDKTGQIYQVLERYANRPDRLKLNRLWQGTVPDAAGAGWVVPPAVSGGRNPVVGVYQKVLRFPGG